MAIINIIEHDSWFQNSMLFSTPPMESNVADLFTKMLPIESRGRLLSSIFIRTQAVDQESE